MDGGGRPAAELLIDDRANQRREMGLERRTEPGRPGCIHETGEHRVATGELQGNPAMGEASHRSSLPGRGSGGSRTRPVLADPRWLHLSCDSNSQYLLSLK